VIERLSVEYEIKPCCQPLGVSRSGYYQWKKQERTQRAKEEAELIQEIKEIFEANKGRIRQSTGNRDTAGQGDAMWEESGGTPDETEPAQGPS
jgi:hypothetical protein